MKLAKIQSEREYKKAYEKEKTSYQTPLDMLNVILAKKAQALTSDINYKQQIHRYTLPPDAMSVQQAKMMQDLQNNVRIMFIYGAFCFLIARNYWIVSIYTSDATGVN